MKLRTIVLCGIVLASFCQTAMAQQQTLEAEHTYIMGDRDTRMDAVRLCYAEAERAAVERAGIFMESNTRVKDFALAEDEVRSFTAAIVHIERLGDDVRLDGQHMSVHCRSKVSFDSEQVLANLERIARDPVLRNELKSAGDAIDSAQQAVARPHNEQDFSNSSGQPEPADGRRPPVSDRRAPPPSRSKDLRDLEALKRKRDAIVQQNNLVSRAGRIAIGKGMSPQQVNELMGAPQAGHTVNRGGHVYTCERYGALWVVYQDNAAMCLRKQLQNRANEGLCNCAGNADTFVWR